MKSREQVLADKNFKQCFLLGWLRFLTYSELESFDLLEFYDDAVASHQIKSSNDWNKLVLPYTEHNLLSGLCILMHKLSEAIVDKNWVMGAICALDVKAWLLILEDNEFDIDDDTLSPDEITKYFNNISKKYKIDIL